MDKCTSVTSIGLDSEHCEVDLDLGYFGPMSDKCASVLAKSDSKQTPGTSNYNYDCPEADCIVWSASIAECCVTIFDGFVPDTGVKNVSSGREVQLYRTSGLYGELFWSPEAPDTIGRSSGLLDKGPDNVPDKGPDNVPDNVPDAMISNSQHTWW